MVYSVPTPLLYVGVVSYCIVLYCIVLYCIVLYCIVLYCIVVYMNDWKYQNIYLCVKVPQSKLITDAKL